MRGTFNLTIEPDAMADFKASCNVVLTKVGRGSRKATVAACEEVLDMSLEQVPRETNTLASSGFYEVTGNYKTGWEGTVGYGGPYDPVNPITGQPASSYMMIVHEDLTAHHPIGKAKFLEDPVREFAKERFPRTVFKYVRESLAT